MWQPPRQQAGVRGGYDPDDPFFEGPVTNPYTGATLGRGDATGGGFQWSPTGGMLGGALGGIAGQLFGGRDPYAAASGELGKIPGMLQQYFDPYVQAGKWALPQLYGQYGALLQDPGAKMAQMGAGFQESPGFEFQRQQAIEAANRAAAAGGMAGTPEEQQQVAQTSTQLANQDYYNYLNHVMNLYQQGLGGTAGLGQMGLQAATGLGEDLASIMEAQAQMAAGSAAYGGQQGAGIGGAIGSAIGGLTGGLL